MEGFKNTFPHASITVTTTDYGLRFNFASEVFQLKDDLLGCVVFNGESTFSVGR